MTPPIFTKLSDKRPKMSKNKTHSFFKESDLVTLCMENGDTVDGFVRQFTQDVTLGNKDWKKGDLLAYSVDDVTVDAVSFMRIRVKI